MFKPAILISALLILASCGSDKNNPQPQQLPTNQPSKGPNSPPVDSGPMFHSNADPNPNAPISGAQFTIFCARIQGDLHVQRATSIKNAMIAATGMKDWYVINQSDQSLLYYGYYRSIDDPKQAAENERIKLDHEKIMVMGDKMGNRPFARAQIVPLDAPDPEAPPEWNLTNAPGDCTLQIAIYKDTPHRKQDAVDTVRAARAQGIEAYYYHGETSSLVCVGHWAKTAYRKSTDVVGGPVNPEQDIVVGPNTSDQDLNQHLADMAEKQNARYEQPKVEILDPTLMDAMKKFPHNAVNGNDIARTVDGKQVFDPSLLIPIPRPQQAAGDQLINPDTPSAPVFQPTTPAPQPGVGRLKSIGN